MSARCRVAILGHSAQVSGAEIAILRLLPEITSVETRVILAEEGPLTSLLRQSDFDVQIIPLPGGLASFTRKANLVANLGYGFSFIRYCVDLAKILRDFDADIVHTNSMKAHLYGGVAGRLARRKVIWHVRDRLATDYLSPVTCFLMKSLSRLIPHHIIANSLATSATIPIKEVTVVHDNQPYLTSDSSLMVDVRDNVRRIGIVGRISPWKGQDIVLQATALSSVGRQAELWVVGDCLFGEESFRTHLEKLASELFPSGQVTFRGFRKDVLSELSQLDIVVHASRIAEPFGQVVIEAMAVGVPIIAANAGGPAEVIDHGVNGLLVEPGDPAALARAIDSLESFEVRRNLANAGRKRALDFTPRQTAESVLAIYRQVLGQRPNP